MITKSKQNWTVGQTAKVGFMSLVVKAAIATPGDSAPDAYFLSNLAGTKFYQFVPHHGLESITVDEAAARVAQFRATLEGIAASEVASALKRMQTAARFNEIFAAA